MESEHADRRDRREPDDRPRRTEGVREKGSAAAATIDAREAKRNAANATTHSTRHATAASGASAKATPPAVATIFPPFEKPRKTGRA